MSPIIIGNTVVLIVETWEFHDQDADVIEFIASLELRFWCARIAVSKYPLTIKMLSQNSHKDEYGYNDQLHQQAYLIKWSARAVTGLAVRGLFWLFLANFGWWWCNGQFTVTITSKVECFCGFFFFIPYSYLLHKSGVRMAIAYMYVD